MRLLHLSDIHLGFEAYRAFSQDGLNQRGEDVLAAYQQANAIILERHPDLVIESGDLFHAPQPSNRALAVAVRALLERHRAGIPTVSLAGNHDVPTQRAAGAAHAVLAALPGVHAVFRGLYEIVPISNVAVHAIPHCLSPEAYRAACAQLTPVNTKYNVFTTHGSYASFPEFRYARGNPQYLDEAWFDDDRWDYIAFGHYHGPTRFRDHVWYAGSLERLSWNEVDHVPGLVCYDLEARTAEFVALEGLRRMEDLGTVVHSARTGAELTDVICQGLGGSIGEDRPILRLKVPTDRATWAHVDQRAVDAVREYTLAVDVLPVFDDAPAFLGETAEYPAIGSLEAEWARYAQETGLPEAVATKGREYLGET